MLLAVDIGNSQTSFGVFEKGKLLAHWRAETEIARTEDEFAAYLFPLFDHFGYSEKNWSGVAICSVVPPVEETFVLFCKKYLKLSPYRVHYQNKLGFKLNVDIPAEVGADRIANSAYAIAKLKLPAIVVDLGTATTFDIVTENKTYEGGIILPGVRMGVESLSRKTSLLPLIDVQFPKSVIGKNTITCIQSGMLFGYCDMLEGLLKRLSSEMQGNVGSIALTGGLSALFKDKLSFKIEHLPDLTLEGIEILYQWNHK